MNKLTIDDWLETAEMSCSKLMKTTAKAGVSLWSDTMIPSNLQMMISHHQFTAHDIIKNLPVAKQSSLVSDVLQILSSTARKYERSVELDLDNSSLEDIFSKLGSDDTQDWQSEAIIDHVMMEEYVENVLSNPKFVSVLLKIPQKMKNHFSRIMSFNQECSHPLVIQLSRAILNQMSEEQLSTVFQTFHQEFGLNNILRSESWEERFV